MSGETWRNLPYSADAAGLQLAAGEAMLAELAQPEPRPALRWYSMNSPALILGASQKLREFDLGACKAAGVTLYRRSSGGTAVLAEPDQIMQDIALPIGHPLHSHDVTESYRWLGEVWAAAFSRLGVQAHLIAVAEARADRQALDDLTKRSCYGGRSPYELLVNGRKVIGLAQVRRRHGALLQTGMYTRWHPRRLANLLAMPSEERAALTARLEARVVGLADVLPEPEQVADSSLFPLLVQTFADVLRDIHGVILVDAEWSSTELQARTAAANRFAPLQPTP